LRPLQGAGRGAALSLRRVTLRLPAKAAPLPGGITVQRALPRRECRAVGPFVFLDHAGPKAFAPGAGMYVPPHPHAGLETVTWLYEGALLHKDSLGNVQTLLPGDLNWMTAGRGIVHSEESEAGFRARGGALHLVQIWAALPADARGMPPAFAHHPAATLPKVERDGARVTLVAGEWDGRRSPAVTQSPLGYLDIALEAGARVALPWTDGWDAAVYVVSGSVTTAGERLVAHDLARYESAGAIGLAADAPARAVLIGGAPLDEPRAIWGNFVLGTVEEARQAQAAFEAGGFGGMPP
jgi:hypothetical protein